MPETGAAQYLPPLEFAKDILGADLWSEQQEVLQALPEHQRVAVKSGNGLGKGYSAAVAVLWFLHCHEPAIVLSTAPTFRQVRHILWRQIRRLYRKAPDVPGGKMLDTRWELPEDRYAMGLSAESADQFQGFHSPNMLIVVDEAHETSFKQEDGVRYNARDVAVMRGHFEKVPVILASATPALESLQMAESGIYEKVDLPSRFGGAELPAIELIDLTEEKPPHGMWLAQRLVDGIEERLERGEQSLLFLNRRGYAPLTLCRNCGFRYQCPNCSAWLVEHRFTRRLACHHCGHEAPAPQACTECGEPDCLVACGPGVERIADEVAERLPQARVFVATSDTLNSPGRAAEFIAAVEAREIDVIVGTQLVTKGFHFPELTLVGVVDADLGLEGGDLRAGERTYQQVAQVAGRAGRGSKPGEVLIQTRHPEAPVIAALAAGDRDAFYSAETEMRREAGAPPFGRWASIIISSEDDGEAREAANRLGAFRPDVADCMILGPAPAPMALLRGRYRYRFLINARRSVQLQHVIRRWLTQVDHPAGVRVAVDIDPYSFV